MKAVLIYDNGEQYAPDITIQAFDSKSELIKFINDKNIGKAVIAAYEYYDEIKIQPVETVTKWEIVD
jgi:hypothetical protein